MSSQTLFEALESGVSVTKPNGMTVTLNKGDTYSLHIEGESMGKVNFDPEAKLPGIEPLYIRVAEKAEVDPDVALEVLRALRALGYTIGTPRVQWR